VRDAKVVGVENQQLRVCRMPEALGNGSCLRGEPKRDEGENQNGQSDSA
jgi:hypothetical protein